MHSQYYSTQFPSKKIAKTLIVAFASITPIAGILATELEVSITGSGDILFTETLGLDEISVWSGIFEEDETNPLVAPARQSFSVKLKTNVLEEDILYWNDFGNWDNPIIAFLFAGTITSYIKSSASNILTPPSVNKTKKLVEAYTEGGPTQRVITPQIKFSVPGPGIEINAGVSQDLILDFEVDLQSGANVVLNQPSILKTLSVQLNSELQLEDLLTVNDTLENYGKILLINEDTNVFQLNNEGSFIATNSNLYPKFIYGSGEVELVNSKIHSSSNLTIGPNAQIIAKIGSLSAGNLLLNEGTIAVDKAKGLDILDTASNADSFENRGLISVREDAYLSVQVPFSSTVKNTLSLGSNSTFIASKTVDLNGVFRAQLSPGTFMQAAQLNLIDARMEILLPENFYPEVGNEFNIIKSTSIIDGEFIDRPHLSTFALDGYRFEIDYGNNVRLRVLDIDQEYHDWAETFFEGQEEGVKSKYSDPDRDGLINVLEKELDLSPIDSASRIYFAFEIEEESMRLEAWPINVPLDNIFFEHSSDLKSWNRVQIAAVENLVAKMLISYPLNTNLLFARVGLALDEPVP